MDLNLGSLTEKAGPLPEWGWILLVSGAGYLVYRRHMKNKSTPTQTTTSDSTGSNTGTDPLTGVPYSQEGNGYTGAILTAQYDELNALGLNTSQVGILNSNLGTATTAVQGNTTATNTNTTAIQKMPVVASTPPLTGAEFVSLERNPKSGAIFGIKPDKSTVLIPTMTQYNAIIAQNPKLKATLHNIPGTK